MNEEAGKGFFSIYECRGWDMSRLNVVLIMGMKRLGVEAGMGFY